MAAGLFLNLFNRWRIDRSTSYLCAYKVLLHLLFIYAKNYDVSFDAKRLKRLIKDPRIWYLNYFPLELVKIKSKFDFCLLYCREIDSNMRKLFDNFAIVSY